VVLSIIAGVAIQHVERGMEQQAGRTSGEATTGATPTVTA
jgi:hypothetical protein